MKFRKQYISEDAQDQKRIEFEELVQGEMTVTEYEHWFSSLIRYAPYILDEGELRAKKFVHKLKPILRKFIVAVGIKSYH